MKDLIQNLTPLFEILTVFFFAFSFDGFKNRVLQIFEFFKWWDILVKKRLEDYKNVTESMRVFTENNAIKDSIKNGVRKSLSDLNKFLNDYKSQIDSLEIPSTYFFSRISFICGFYCLFILSISAYPLGDSAYAQLGVSLSVFSLFFVIILILFSALDFVGAYFSVPKVRNIIEEILLIRLSHLKLAFFFSLFFIITLVDCGFDNFLFKYLIIFDSINSLYSMMISPVLIIVLYTLFYQLKYRRFRKLIRPINATFNSVMNDAKIEFEKANYAHKIMLIEQTKLSGPKICNAMNNGVQCIEEVVNGSLYCHSHQDKTPN
ncbi:MAG: hypothetical protein JXQ90_21685 [Cyclobacteriaceae bacterium]